MSGSISQNPPKRCSPRLNLQAVVYDREQRGNVPSAAASSRSLQFSVGSLWVLLKDPKDGWFPFVQVHLWIVICLMFMARVQ